MRIRAIRPEFWHDEKMAALSLGARLFYIGLWNVADDDGWMDWKATQIGAVLFPYETVKWRLRNIDIWKLDLVMASRLIIHECGCGEIPTFRKHQKLGGKPNVLIHERHESEHGTDRSGSVRIDLSVKVGKGKGGKDKEGGVGSEPTSLSDYGWTRPRRSAVS